MKTTSTIYRGYELIRTSYEFSIEMSSAADVEFYKNLACNCPENGYLLTNDNGYVVGYKQYTYVAINLENGIMLLDKLTSYLSIKHMIDMYL